MSLNSCVKYFELKSLLDGRKDEWVDGWESRVKDCLQQSKITEVEREGERLRLHTGKIIKF